ncbi:DUF4129 domain-containing protein [Haloarcula sp. S1CR25-12]|uniref:DUF4129 domain-containing protein n=1 Tax=Haloarcula saliterrae TaxID=2950534 RepID=A0ABU2F9K1_9EURY|nr:DUF4129 domain-containing protein [Haloarcula sp. S1CR25-12]MDS0258953.1 DUF4129 domain-containing protein [Haloarcula sp. S1CR25-12]
MGTTGDGGVEGVDSRQLLLVGVCLVGLVMAAFLAPVTGANGLFGSGDGTGLQGGNGGDIGGDPPSDGSSGDGSDGERYDPGGDGGFGDSDEPVDVREAASGCRVDVRSDPKPGTTTTVAVTVDGEPASDVRVWFNGEFVGHTDGRGLVTGTVPYVTELNVTVESPIDEPCTFSEPESVGPGQFPLVGAGVSVAGAGGVATAASIDAGRATGQRPASVGVNNSSDYDVASAVTIRVTGDPVPNSTVALFATVEGVPMPNATVAVDGERVGQTDGSGRYRLTVPESDSIDVTVSRGEIRGQRTIDVWQLNVGFVPGLFVPGERAAVTVTRNETPVPNATVTLAGETLGTTGSDGRLTFRLPTTLSGTVRAATATQTDAVPLWRAYWLTGGLTLGLSVFALATTLVTARLRGRGAAKRVARWWTAVGLLFGGYVLGERLGLAAAGTVVLLVGLYRYRRAVASGGATAAEQIVGFLEWCKLAVLRVVAGVESGADWLRRQAVRLAAWLRSLPTSVSALAARFGAWLRTLPGRLGARLRSLPLRGVAAVCLALGVVVGATYAFGAPGLLVSAALVGLAAVGWWLRRRGDEVESTERATEKTGATDPEAAADDGSAPALRQLWRRFAEWVTPSTWRTRTPAEVSRAAIDRGLPRQPVEALTEAFRDVEYGGEPEQSRRDQARTAYEALEATRHREEDEE